MYFCFRSIYIMEPFIVSARKYRPQTFKDVVGQQAITDTLENAIAQNHLAQALLFCGPRGVGKTTCARILAKKINQDNTQKEDEDFAFNIFELDAASNNSVDDIRNLIDQVRIPPQVGKYKVYIIDEVHMLSQSAFNAFLKTLEEPPKHAIFILATTEKHKIIPTILSRCQIFDFKRITVKDAAAYLAYISEQQGVVAEQDALHIIAQKADGAMRDALSIFDRVVSFSGKQLTRKAVTENLNVLDYDTFFETTELIVHNKIPELLLLFNKTLALGFDGHHFIGGLASHFRDLLVCQQPETQLLLEVSVNTQTKYATQAQQLSREFLIAAIELANDCDLKYKASKNQRLLVELTLMKLASLTFSSEKKKADFIIPATYFRKRDFEKTSEYAIVEDVQPQVAASELQQKASARLKKDVASEPRSSQKPILLSNPAKERVSGLSLSSLKAKKEHEASKKPSESAQDLPNKPFTEAEMQKHWNNYINMPEIEGKKILASNLQADTPRLKGNDIIWIELPNDTMKKEVEREQGSLLNFLKDKLHNYSVTLTISVNEENAKQYAFTPEEKYEKLKEKNPAIELLRKEFDLDF